jgi:hypothetical protein
MARIRESGPPGNQNAFRHRSGGDFTAGVNGPLTPDEHAIREEILAGLVSDKGGAAQISTAMPVLAEGDRSRRHLAGCVQPGDRRVYGMQSKGAEQP